MSTKKKLKQTTVSAIISIICMQFAFADVPGWIDSPGLYQYTSTLNAALVKQDGTTLTGTDLCGICDANSCCETIPNGNIINGTVGKNDILAAFDSGADGIANNSDDNCRGIA